MSSSAHTLQVLATVFISYAHKDKALKERLEEHLSNLRYRGLISLWHDGEIQAGDEWENEINAQLENASVVLLLISASFMASNYCYNIEMRQALERYEQGIVNIIPILLRPVMFANAPFAHLQFLPSNGKSITTWRNRDSAFVNVALGIEKILLRQQGQRQITSSQMNRGWTRSWQVQMPGASLLNPSSSPQRVPFVTRLRVFYARIFVSLNTILLRMSGQQHKAEQTYYQQALKAYQDALARNPADMVALKGKGLVLEALKNYSQALDVFHQWATQVPHAFPYTHIGDIFLKLNRPHDALEAYEQAISCDPQYALAYHGRGKALAQLKRASDAEQAYKQARQAGYEEV